MGEKFPIHEQKENQGREWLLVLEKTGKYIFHGSPEKVEGFLEPKQSLDKNKPHGDPSVSGTQYADIAIFRSIINTKNFPEDHASSFGVSLKNNRIIPEFETSKFILSKLKDKSLRGYVYVFSKDVFSKFGDSLWEVRSNLGIKPILIVEVGSKDLPTNINSLKDL